MNEQEIESRAQKAVELFKQGYNCSQAVFASCADIYGIKDENIALRLAASFGGGMGRMRLVCGAASGMFLLAGLHNGSATPHDNEGKMANYAFVQQLAVRGTPWFGAERSMQCPTRLRPSSGRAHTGVLRETSVSGDDCRSSKNLFAQYMIVQNLIELIGHTPMLEIQPGLLLKLERFNPGGSVKDRTALAMIEDAEQRGLLTPGATIIEPTSGNTGVGLAWIGRLKGYRVILTMPDTMSVERRNLLAAYGAELILTPGAEGMKGAVAKAEQLRDELPNALILGQFTNPANPAIHYTTTGQEIWDDTHGQVDVFIAGVGTGGTVSGVGRALKERNFTIEVIAVEPASSPLLTQGHAGAHKIQGIGANFVPDTYQAGYIDRVLPVADEDALNAARTLARDHGLLVGISSGAAYAAALQLTQQPEYKGKTIVVLLPDTGERYLSVL